MSIHVECTGVGVMSRSGTDLPVESVLQWSESVALAGATTQSVPTGIFPAYVLTVTARADVYISIGAVPAPGADPRRLLLRGMRCSFGANPGDKVGWASA